jgi:hypothetical protein
MLTLIGDDPILLSFRELNVSRYVYFINLFQSLIEDQLKEYPACVHMMMVDYNGNLMY